MSFSGIVFVSGLRTRSRTLMSEFQLEKSPEGSLQFFLTFREKKLRHKRSWRSPNRRRQERKWNGRF